MALQLPVLIHAQTMQLITGKGELCQGAHLFARMAIQPTPGEV